MKKILFVIILLIGNYFGFAQNLIIYKHFGINNKQILTVIVEDSQSVKKFNYSQYTDSFIPNHIIKLGSKEYKAFLSIAAKNELKDSCCTEFGIGVFKVYFLNKGKEQIFYLRSCKSASLYFNQIAQLSKDNGFNSDLENSFESLHTILNQYVSIDKSK